MECILCASTTRIAKYLKNSFVSPQKGVVYCQKSIDAASLQ